MSMLRHSEETQRVVDGYSRIVAWGEMAARTKAMNLEQITHAYSPGNGEAVTSGQSYWAFKYDPNDPTDTRQVLVRINLNLVMRQGQVDVWEHGTGWTPLYHPQSDTLPRADATFDDYVKTVEEIAERAHPLLQAYVK